MTTHNWQSVDGGFVCAACGLKSLKGTSRGECKPRGSKPPIERVEIPKPKMRGRGPCKHRGEQATKDGEPWLHRCGCPSSEKMPVYTCDVHGLCVLTAIVPPAGVTRCSRCKDHEAVSADE